MPWLSGSAKYTAVLAEGRARMQTAALSWFAKPLERRICFIHVPKCGGTSLHLGIARQYRPGQVHYLQTADSTREAHALGRPLMEHRRDILRRYMQDERIRYVGGHVAFDRSLYDPFANSWDFITVLRDPVARFLSDYFFNRYKLSTYGRIEEELPQFLETRRSQEWAHTLLLYFGGYRVGEPTGPALERAKENLRLFRLMSFVEDPKGMQRDFESTFQRALDVGRVKTSPVPKGEPERQVTSELRARLQSMCAADLELYAYARSLRASAAVSTGAIASARDQ